LPSSTLGNATNSILQEVALDTQNVLKSSSKGMEEVGNQTFTILILWTGVCFLLRTL